MPSAAELTQTFERMENARRLATEVTHQLERMGETERSAAELTRRLARLRDTRRRAERQVVECLDAERTVAAQLRQVLVDAAMRPQAEDRRCPWSWTMGCTSEAGHPGPHQSHPS